MVADMVADLEVDMVADKERGKSGAEWWHNLRWDEEGRHGKGATQDQFFYCRYAMCSLFIAKEETVKRYFDLTQVTLKICDNLLTQQFLENIWRSLKRYLPVKILLKT